MAEITQLDINECMVAHTTFPETYTIQSGL